MNFTPTFLTPFTSTALPVNSASVPQLSTAKFASAATTTGGGQVVAVLNSDESGVTYLRPIDTHGFVNLGGALNNQQHNQIITLPITIPGSKPGEQPQQQTLQIQVVNPNSGGNSDKVLPLSLQHFGQVLHVAYNHQTADGLQLQLQTSDVGEEITGDQTNSSDNDNNSSQSLDQQGMNSDSPVLDVKPTLAELHQQQDQHAAAYPLTVVVPPEIILRTALGDSVIETNDKNAEDSKEKERLREGMNSWQAAPVTSSVAEYLSHLPADSLPLSLHHFLKFSNDTIKRESAVESSPLSNPDDGTEGHMLEMNPDDPENDQLKGKKKKKYKKKPPKPRRPRPGQVHIATALDGTLLFCCPECNMAYPDKEMLEQHLVAHKIDRRYICDICGAGLKRKEHLERHKLGHNPERPYVCEVCTKGFKRKEHLNLHAVIHSGEKTEICGECGKGFYRRDHLRKHTKSHIAKRMREELHQQQQQLHQLQEQHHQQQQQQQQHQQHHTILITTPQENGNGDHPNTLIIQANPAALAAAAQAAVNDHHVDGSGQLMNSNSPDPLEGAVILPATTTGDENGHQPSLIIQQRTIQQDQQQQCDEMDQSQQTQTTQCILKQEP